MIFVDVQEKQTRTARTSLWDYWLIHSLRKARFASPAPSMYVSVRVRRLVLFLSFFFFSTIHWLQYQQPGLTKLVFDSTLTSNPEVEKKPVRSVRQIRQTMYVPMFSAFRLFKRMGGEGREHIISLSSANKADHQQKVSHTCWWWQRHITPTEDRNTFRLGARREGESLNCGYLASLRDWTCCASVWYCFPSTARWNQSVW